VGQIHDAISDHISGDGSLGDRISDLTPGGDEPADEDDEDASDTEATANATAA